MSFGCVPGMSFHFSFKRFQAFERQKEEMYCKILIFFVFYLLTATHASTLSNKGFKTAQKVEDPARWTRVYQLDELLVSIDGKLNDMNERQKIQESSNDGLADLQGINHRLQNIEEQIARAESFNKIRLEKIFDSIMKAEFTIDQLNHRINKTQALLTNRIADVETTIDKLVKIQDDSDKTLKKILAAQNDVASNIKNMSEVAKDAHFKTNQSLHALNASHQTFQQHLLTMARNASSHDELTKKIRDIFNNTGNFTPKCAQNEEYAPEVKEDDTAQEETIKLIAMIENVYNDLRQQGDAIEAALKEAIGIGNKIHKKIDNHEDIDDLLQSHLAEVSQEITHSIRKANNGQEGKWKQNFESILSQQETFAENCNRLQMNDDHIENKMVSILEGLLETIDNKTNSVNVRLDKLLKNNKNEDSCILTNISRTTLECTKSLEALGHRLNETYQQEMDKSKQVVKKEEIKPTTTFTVKTTKCSDCMETTAGTNEKPLKYLNELSPDGIIPDLDLRFPN